MEIVKLLTIGVFIFLFNYKLKYLYELKTGEKASALYILLEKYSFIRSFSIFFYLFPLSPLFFSKKRNGADAALINKFNGVKAGTFLLAVFIIVMSNLYPSVW